MSVTTAGSQQPGSLNLEETLRRLQELENQEEIGSQEGVDNQPPMDEPQQEETGGIDLAALDVPLNPLYSETFNANQHILGILGVTVGSSAVAIRGIGPAFTVLDNFLKTSVEHGLPKFLGIGVAGTSMYFLKKSVNELILGDGQDQQRSILGSITNRAWAAAKTAFWGYSTLSGLGMLGTSSAVSLALIGGAALVRLNSSSPQNDTERAEVKSSWLGQKATSTIKTGTVAYGIIAGIANILGYQNSLGLPTLLGWMESAIASAGTGQALLSGGIKYAAQTPAYIFIAMGLMFGQQLIQWRVIGQAFQKLNKELENFNNANKYSGTYEMLGNISLEEYRSKIAEAMGAPKFDDIAPIFEQLRSRNEEYPELAARPIIAKLVVLDSEIANDVKKYNELLAENKLSELDKFLNEELKPKLFMQVYLKHCLVNPRRPELGQVAKDGEKYASLVPHLFAQLESQDRAMINSLMQIGQEEVAKNLMLKFAQEKEALIELVANETKQKPAEVKFPRMDFSLSELNLDAISAEASSALLAETKLQNIYYQLKIQRQILFQQLMQALAAAQEEEAPAAQ